MKILAVAFLLIACASCGNEKLYRVKVVNNTPFHLDTVAFYFDTTAIPPYSASRIYDIRYREGFALSRPMFSVFVLSYSDSTGVYPNWRGNAIPIDMLSEDSLNILEIATESDPHYLFSLSSE